MCSANPKSQIIGSACTAPGSIQYSMSAMGKKIAKLWQCSKVYCFAFNVIQCMIPYAITI